MLFCGGFLKTDRTICSNALMATAHTELFTQTLLTFVLCPRWTGLRSAPLMVKTDPYATLTVREFAASEQPHLLDEQFSVVLKQVEQQGFELARRLSVDGNSDRLPAYIWQIVFDRP